MASECSHYLERREGGGDREGGKEVVQEDTEAVLTCK